MKIAYISLSAKSQKSLRPFLFAPHPVSEYLCHRDISCIKTNDTGMGRIGKEKRMVEFMTGLYCRHVHGADNLCGECAEVLAYAHDRLDRCPYGDEKKSCRRCSIHCYRPDMRLKIKTIMRYSGPRMFFFAPLESLRHL